MKVRIRNPKLPDSTTKKLRPLKVKIRLWRAGAIISIITNILLLLKLTTSL